MQFLSFLRSVFLYFAHSGIVVLVGKDFKKLVFVDVSVFVFVDNLEDIFYGGLWYFFILKKNQHLLVRNYTIMVQIKIYEGFFIMHFGQNLHGVQAGDQKLGVLNDP
jgi:hypothetical protein